METEGKLFTPNPARTFTRKVTFKVPTESGADSQATLKTTFRSMPKDELTEMQRTFEDDYVYQNVVVGVEGVGDGSGGALEPAKATNVMAQESSFVYEAVVEYYNAMLGGNLKPKTSKGRRATG